MTDSHGPPDEAGSPAALVEMNQPRTDLHAARRCDLKQHFCPGRCARAVPNDRYACGPCWRKLPGHLQRAIGRTVGDPVLSPARTCAFTAAVTFYTALLSGSTARPRRDGG
jgi:hypothetical protein